MLDLTRVPDAILAPVARVVDTALGATGSLSAQNVMIVGAWCRDIMLGTEVAQLIGPQRLSELLARWPGDASLLNRYLTLRGNPGWPSDPSRRQELLDALTRGLTTSI